MSKKDFKKAIGGLYKSKLVALHSDCISLLQTIHSAQN
jgi:predicted RNA-binding protein (virulence factor B family)